MTRIAAYLSLSMVLIWTACSEERQPNVVVGKAKMIEIEAGAKPMIPRNLKFKFSNLELFQELETLNLEQFKKYGTFYTKDFTIYHIKDLDLLEDNLYIGEIYLYFIDDKLHKIQAHTTKNMSSFFLSKYGGAKLVLSDEYNKSLVKSEGALHRRGGKLAMNKNLSNYKLKWHSGDRYISYQVDETAQKSFETLEETIDLDNQKKIKVNPKYVFSIISRQYTSLLSRVKMDELLAHNQ